MKHVLTLLTIGIIVAACASDGPSSGNGVDDVHQSCEIRAQWVRTNNDCNLCESAVIAAHCDCESLKAFSGACLDQENKRKSACAAAANLDTCIVNCNASETGDGGVSTVDPCTCRDNCYAAANNAACKKASDDRDGCIAAACASHCK